MARQKSKTTAIAHRRGPSPAIAKLKQQIASKSSSLARLRKDVKESQVPNALMGAAAMGGGAAAIGVLKSLVGGEELAGVRVEPVAGIATGAVGVALGQPWVIYLGAGMLAPFIADKAEDLFDSVMESAGDAAEKLKNAANG